MTRLSQSPPQEPVLIFLPVGAGDVIAARLAEHGYRSTVISSIADVASALSTQAHCLAITTRPDIDIVRNIRSIPVVNLEVFFHSSPSRDGLMKSSKQFDSKAFLARIRALTEPRPARTEMIVSPAGDGLALKVTTKRSKPFKSLLEGLAPKCAKT
ncbi:hypothetical protein [Rhizobium sp. Root1204]|uniref:hypothetical protein n=1 Tax=Rhizobium sp. Root1204 TaxID=1736428 RepID=UPI000713BE22|nr:hypothetical protein [Rhizobium sp. Root1204]KQV41191.1 hypothetical protein ASC96_17935 [Rhizobium sp. Root1204]